MTRLIPADIAELGLDWKPFDQLLFELTGSSLLSLAAGSLGVTGETAESCLAGKTVAVVPDTSGEGLIEGFSEALVRIARRLGCQAFITVPDSKGLTEAQDRGADFVLTSTDEDFICLNQRTLFQSENGKTTGRGFAYALDRMSGGKLRGETVLTIGAGPVGTSAIKYLTDLGARVIVHDIVPEKAIILAQKITGLKVWSPEMGDIPSGFKYIIEASTSGQVHPVETVQPGALISAPGMPFSFSPSSRYRLWSEPLATGTAVMLLMAALGPE
jgi:pyrrolysine biosynthesis protein PylD